LPGNKLENLDADVWNGTEDEFSRICLSAELWFVSNKLVMLPPWSQGRHRPIRTKSSHIQPIPQMASITASRPGLLAPVRQRRSLTVKAISAPDQKTSPSIKSSNGLPWFPASWRNFPAQQQPEYPDQAAVKKALTELSSYPPLIFAGECRTLQGRLAKAAVGEAFIVQVRESSCIIVSTHSDDKTRMY
jgi:hypothetical protein